MQTAGGATLNTDEAAGTTRSGSPRRPKDQAPAGGSAATAPVRGYTRAALGVLGFTAVLAVTLDQVIKALATHHLTEGQPVRVLGGLIYLSLLRNGGAAFSLGSHYTWVFPVITVAVIGWIVWMGRRLRSVPWAVALGLVLGGALGNLADRLFRAPGPFRGHVVDMISLLAPYGRGFAIFNIADSCLTLGVALAVLLELTGRQRDGSRARPASKE